MHLERALVVYKKSVFQLYVEEHHDATIQRAIEAQDPIALRLVKSHEVQSQALADVQRTLAAAGIEHVIRWRAQLRTLRGFDLIIALGGDGTVLDVAQRIRDDTPLLGINSNPESSSGVLCAGTASELGPLLRALREDHLAPLPTARLRVSCDGEDLLGPCLNDVLFAHPCPAELSRFQLLVAPTSRAHEINAAESELVMIRSSGLWVSTATGSTAAIHSAGGRVLPRGSRRLQYLCRERIRYNVARSPFRTRGEIRAGEALIIVSRVRRGMLWADGPHRRCAVPYGRPLVVDLHPAALQLVPRTTG